MISAFFLSYCLMTSEERTEKYINAVVVWTLFVFVMTEILSLFRIITTLNLWICWLALDLLLLIVNTRKCKKTGWKWKDHLPAGRHITAGKTIGIILSVGIVYLALKTTPYNWDSMTYHLPRIFHWLQNGSVEHYATHIDRQVASPVLGAFVNLHVYSMASGNEWPVNLLQCFSYLTNGLLVYQIAAKIKCSGPYCVMAAILYFSMPIAFAEALSTQVDNYSTLWMLCFAYLVLNLMKPEERLNISRRNLFRVIMVSLCVAFGYLAKPSVGIGMVIFAFWLLLVMIRRRDSISAAAVYALTGGCVLALILAPEFYRNIVTFSSFSSPDAGQRQLIGSLHLRHVLVNFVKNFTFNMPTVWLYDSSFIIWKYVMRFARLLEIDIDSPVISEDGREFVVRNAQNYGNSTAVNPLIIWLLIGCALLFLFKNGKRHLSEVRNQYFIAAAFSFLCFCAVLRWEPFVSRYMISYLAVLCPAVVGQLEMFLEGQSEEHLRKRAGIFAIIYFLCITELIGLVCYHGHIARDSKSEEYFVSRREIEESYKEIVNFVNEGGYDKIGLLTGGDSYEYPLDAMIKNGVRLEHMNVMNATGKYENADFVPDIIIAVNFAPDDVTICHGCEYELKMVAGEDICVLGKRGNI